MDRGILLNREEIGLTASFLRKSPMVYTCRNIIQHQIFSNGITFSHRRGRIKPDPHMQEIMNDYWLPFCKDLVDTILTMGIAVVRVITLEDGLQYPVVLEPNCCRIKMLYDMGIRSYAVLNDQQEEVDSAFVLDIFGFTPSANGSLTSLVANILPKIRYMNLLLGTSIRMEQKRASPVIMTEAVDTKVDGVEGIQYDYYADGDMQDQSDRNKFRRNRSNVQQLQQQQSLYDSFFSSHSAIPSAQGNVLDNVVTLPLGQRIVNMPQQTGRGDLIAQIKMHEDAICAIMGVPRSLVMSDTPHKSDSEGTHQTFQKTIMSWKTHIETACEQIYNIIYAETIKGQLMQAMNKKRKRDVADVYALKKRIQVEIRFPISPFMSHDQLYIHYQRGVLPWDTYVEHACAQGCLPHQKMPEPSQKQDDPNQSANDSSEDSNEKEKGSNNDTSSEKTNKSSEKTNEKEKSSNNPKSSNKPKK